MNCFSSSKNSVLAGGVRFFTTVNNAEFIEEEIFSIVFGKLPKPNTRRDQYKNNEDAA